MRSLSTGIRIFQMEVLHRVAFHYWGLPYQRGNLSKAADIHLAVTLGHGKTIHTLANQVVDSMDIRAVMLIILKRINSHVAMVGIGGVVTVAGCKVNMAHLHFREIDVGYVHVIVANGIH